MTRRDILLRRIEALLHHPPERSLTEGFEDEAERAAAAQHLGVLGLTPEHESAVVAADRVAAGSNEYHFPEQSHAGEQGPPVVWRRAPWLRHPLSGAEVRLDDLLNLVLDTEPQDEELRDALSEALHQAPDAFYTLGGVKPLDEINDDDLERIARWLWRDLPDYLAERDTRTPWLLLPADPRLPDHSVWEHLSLTAALATAGLGPKEWNKGKQPSTASLFLFTLGPVQGFVGAARKTRDLQAGSYLLSHLTWQAIRVVAEALGPETILFPDLRRQPPVDRWLQKQGVPLTNASSDTGAATIPNRFFAVVPTEKVEELARAAENAVRDEFTRIGKFALSEIKRNIADSWKNRVDWSFYEKQVHDYFECYWTALPFHRFGEHEPKRFVEAFEAEYGGVLRWDDGKANAILRGFAEHDQHPNVGAVYGRLYRLTEAFTGSRKALRDFRFVDEHGYRCSLIPSLPALAPTDEKHKDGTPLTSDVRRFWAHLAQRTERGHLAEGEQLSAVALAKRFVGKYLKNERGIDYDARFPSTGSFATADFKADVIEQADAGLERCVESLRTTLREVAGEILALRQDDEQDRTSALSDARRDKLFTEAPLPLLKSGTTEGSVLRWLAELDGGWLFDEAYSPERVQKEYVPQEQKDEATAAQATLDAPLRNAHEKLHTLLAAADEARIDRPSKYYAVLQMDGDTMGEWLSGQRAPLFGDALHPHFERWLRGGGYSDWISLIDGDSDPEPNDPDEGRYRRPLTPALHLAISRALGVFSLTLVPRLTEEEHLARRIYSGGDDVLAFTSFRDAIPLAHRLRAAFSGQIREETELRNPNNLDQPQQKHLVVDWTKTTGYAAIEDKDGGQQLLPTMGHTATASTGIVIAHYKQSLPQVFHEAHRACEEVAKDQIGRNALAVTVLKRSGEHFETGTPWYSTSGNGADKRVGVDLAEALERYADLVRGGWVASGYVYDLDAEVAGLRVFELERRPNENDSVQDDGSLAPAHEAVMREAYRLFQRRTEALRTPDVTRLPGWLAEGEDSDWTARAFDATVRPLLNHNPLDRLILLLDAAQFFGQGGDR